MCLGPVVDPVTPEQQRARDRPEVESNLVLRGLAAGAAAALVGDSARRRFPVSSIPGLIEYFRLIVR